MKKGLLLALAAVVIWLGLSYRTARKVELGERLVADAYAGDLLAVKNDLEEGAPLDYVLYFKDEQRQYGGADFNALQAAASSGNEDVINFLLDQGLDINAPTPQGWTPLFIAVRDGRSEAAKLLVYRESKLNTQTDLGATPLIMAVTQKFPSEKERQDLLLYMLKREADPNLADHAGNTPLYYAAALRNAAAAKLLVEHGAKPDKEARAKMLKILHKKPDASSKKITALIQKAAK